MFLVIFWPFFIPTYTHFCTKWVLLSIRAVPRENPRFDPLKTRFFRVRYTPFWTFLSTCIFLMFFYHFLYTFWWSSVSLFHVFLILSDINHSLEHVFVIRCVVLMHNNYMFILTSRRTQMIMNVSWNAFFNFSTRGGTAHHFDPFQESLYFL